MGFNMKLQVSVFFASLIAANFAMAQTSAEVTCRAQAKELAVQAYSSCITTARTNQVEEIRKNYQQELADLKKKYDQELKKMKGAAPKPSEKAALAVSKPSPRKNASPMGLARQLPGKTTPTSEAVPVQTLSTETAVLAVSPETSYEPSPGIEQEAAEADQVDFVEMPVE